MTEELKPCPFCGAQATLLRDRISCDACLSDMGKLKTETDAHLIASWNLRAPPPSPSTVWRVLQELKNPYNEQDHGPSWQVSAHAWDEAMIAAMRAVDGKGAAGTSEASIMLMAGCMDMVRQELIEAGVIDKAVPPMMVANAVLAHIARQPAAATADAKEAAELQTLLIDEFSAYRPTYPAGLYAWARIALLDNSPHRALPVARQSQAAPVAWTRATGDEQSSGWAWGCTWMESLLARLRTDGYDTSTEVVDALLTILAAPTLDSVPQARSVVTVDSEDFRDALRVYAENHGQLGEGAARYEVVQTVMEWHLANPLAPTLGSAPQADADESRALWETALAHAAMYVEHHCVDGERHAEAIMGMGRPTFSPAPQAERAAVPDHDQALKLAEQAGFLNLSGFIMSPRSDGHITSEVVKLVQLAAAPATQEGEQGSEQAAPGAGSGGRSMYARHA